MIREIFLPQEIQGYYLFPKRIIGFTINKTRISATQVYFAGTTTTIEKYIEKQLEPGNSGDYSERAVKAIQSILKSLDSYDAIYSSLSSSLCIFKELRLPFLSYEKIGMVINFEVEPLLPFSVNDAVIDFIITKKNPVDKSSEVLIAAVQNHYIEEHLSLFKAAGVSPDVVTIDLFALYGLYTKINSYADLPGSVALIDIGLQSTHIAYIHNGQLRFIRTLPQGVLHQVKAVADSLNIPTHTAMEDMICFGMKNESDKEYSQALKQASTDFWGIIQFTLQSFITQTTTQQTVDKLLLLGKGAELKELPLFVQELLKTPCEVFNVAELLKEQTIKFKNNTLIPSSGIVSLSTATQSQITKNFNLRKGMFALESNTIFTKQILMACVLTITLITGLAIYNYSSIQAFKNEAIHSEAEAIKMLKKQFPDIERDENDLEEIISQATYAVAQEEEMWFAFSHQARSSFLKFLLELTSKIDKEGLGLKLESISITHGIMTVKAEVKDHAALGNLEKSLRQSKLFRHVEGQDDTKFTMKIFLAKNSKGQ